MKHVSPQVAAEVHQANFFLKRYQRILHYVFQGHHQEAIHLISDLIEEVTEPDQLLMLYRMWIDVLMNQQVVITADRDGWLGDITTRTTVNPALRHLYQHLQQINAEEIKNDGGDEEIYHQSWLALQGLAGLYLGEYQAINRLIDSQGQWQMSPYVEELAYRLHQDNAISSDIKFEVKNHQNTGVFQSFWSTRRHFMTSPPVDPLSSFYDYPVMRSLVEYAVSSQNDAVVKTVLAQMDEWFGFTMARGMWELDQAVGSQDHPAIQHSMAQLRLQFQHNEELVNLESQISEHFDVKFNSEDESVAAADVSSDSLIHRCNQLVGSLSGQNEGALLVHYQAVCQAYIQNLATKDLDVQCPADQKVEQIIERAWHQIASLYGIATQSTHQRPPQAWVCFISDECYEANFLRHLSHNNLLVAMGDTVKNDDVVFVVKRVGEGSRLLGIYEVYFAPQWASCVHSDTVLKPVMLFNQQSYAPIKLTTYELDVAETAEIKKRFGLEEVLELTSESFMVIINEIKAQTGVASEDLDSLALDRGLKDFA